MNCKKMWRLITAVVLAAMLITGCGGAASGIGGSKAKASAFDNILKMIGKENEDTDQDTDQDTEPETPAVSGIDCSVNLAGKEYTLPFDFSELLDDGWTTSADLDAELDGLTYTLPIFIRKNIDGEKEIRVCVFNGTGNNMKARDCQVTEFIVYSNDTNLPSFALSNGITVNDDPETVTTIMGTPTYTYEGETTLSYDYGEDRETGQISFDWHKGDDSYNELSISHYVRKETETSSETPEYLDEYQAPDAMGDDFDSGTFTLNGVVYRLSCPMSEFVKNGWVITRDESIAAGRVGGVDLKKKGVEMHACVRNNESYQTYASNCPVLWVSFSIIGSDDPIPDLLLPKGLTFKTDLETLESILGSSSVSFEKSETEYSYTYRYADYDLNTELVIDYNKDDGRISGIRIERDMWP